MKEHKVSLQTAILLTMNILIGSGILLGPGVIASVSGNASFITWPVVALIFLPLVICTAQLSNMFPGCGGFYSYAKEGLNKTAGFISAWLYLIGYTFAIALDIILIRGIFISNGLKNAVTLNPMLFNVLFLTVSFFISLFGLKIVSRIFNSLTITKILPLAILVLLLPFVIKSGFTISTSEVSMIPYSLPMAIFGFFGFEYCCGLTHLIEDSKRNAPRAILIGFILTAILYTLFHFGLLNLMGSTELSRLGASSFAQFLTIPYLKEFLMFLIPVASILAIFAGANGMLNANAIMINSLAQEKLFLFNKPLAKLSSNGRPWIGSFVITLFVFAILVLVPNVSIANNISNLSICSSFLFPFLSLFVIQKRRSMYSKIPLVLLSIAITFGLCIYSLYQLGGSMTERLTNSLPFVAVLGLGLILYFLRKEK